MALKVKISKEGFDVLKETDSKNFIFDSELNHLKTSESSSYTETLGNSSSTTKTIAHGLSYRPMALAYWKEDSEGVWRIASTDPENVGIKPSTNSNLSLYCDATNVYLKLQNGNATGGDRDYTVKYEIFYEGDQ